MTDHSTRSGAPRDVPPPRPVASPEPAPEETGLGRAARAVAEAVSGLVGGAGGRSEAPDGGPGASVAGGLREVVSAVAGAVAAAFAPQRESAAPPGAAGVGTAGPERSPGALLGDLLSAAAPRLPIRDADRLRGAHPGLSDREIADALVGRAARLTATIGAATGGLSAAHWLAPASLLALPVELGAETVLVAGVEVVLIGELHELHGRRAPGDARARAGAYLAGWSAQRSVDGAGTAGLGSLLTGAGVRALQRRLGRRLAGAVPAAAPLLIGAAIAGRGNRRTTEKLAERVLADLRATRPLT
ncbi:hypothetical protein [Blastococcus tunisiensis]|uniref:EcsC protein family protein n=1 Tax=Blastococcus tunisiensis TaxID=1798228 RepID=A0A1I2IME6_9ACTN|nr:hypothetical protein [Blastococcus sp. DSM 46838]SFF42207.1 hypothetical protein SAMN05216574_11389 [Blastococcus sp. DSM 46838]